MYKPALALLLLLIAPLVHGTSTETSGPPPLVIGLIDFPPLSHYDEAGQPAGLLLPIMQRVAEHAGYRPEFRILPIARLVQGMQDGSIRVWPGIPGKVDLASHTLVGSQPLSQLSINLYHRSDTRSPRWPDDVRGQDLIMMTGYDYGPDLSAQVSDPQNRLRVHRTHNHSAAIGMLLHRRADFLLNYQAPMDDAMAQRPEVELQHLRLYRTPLLLVVSDVGRPAGATLLAELEDALVELQNSGQLPALPQF